MNCRFPSNSLATRKYWAPLRPEKKSTFLPPNSLLLIYIESLRSQFSCLLGLTAGLVPCAWPYSDFLVFALYLGGLIWLPFRCCYLLLLWVMLPSSSVLPHFLNWFSLGSSLTVRCPGSILSLCSFRAIKQTGNLWCSRKCNTLLETNKFQGELLCEFVRISACCRIYAITHLQSISHL